MLLQGVAQIVGRTSARSAAGRLVYLVLLVAMPLVSVSCAVRPAPSEGPTGRLPGDTAPDRVPSREPCSQAAVSLLNRNLSAVGSVKATLNLTISTQEPHFSTRVQAGLLAAKPNKLRLKVYAGPVNVADLATDGDSIWVYVPPRALLVLGTVEEALRSTPDSESANILLVIGLREVLFPGPLGSARAWRLSHTSKLDRKTCGAAEDLPGSWGIVGLSGPESLQVNRAGVRREVVFDSRKGLLKEMRLTGADSGELMQAVYADYRKSGKGLFPHDISVAFPAMGLRLRFGFDRVEVTPRSDDPSFGQSPFRPETPQGTLVRQMSELPN